MGADTINMFDKHSLIQRLKELSFPEKEYWVVAGGAMVLHGFRQQTRDIDLGCSTLLADELEHQGYFVSHCDDGTRRIAYSKDIEIFENWLEGTVEIINGVPVVCRRTYTNEKETWQGKRFSGYCINEKVKESA